MTLTPTPWWCRFLSALLTLPGIVAASNAQAAPPRATATLQGVVVKDPGSEPVKKALIELIAENQTEGGDYTAISSADGSFRIERIAPGRYHLFAERTGYLEVDKHHPRADGRVLTLAAGQEINDILIRLQAAAVVEGRVTDEDGDPLPNADVAVLRQTYISGHAHWEQAGAERTNDLGEYRIAGLGAGTYYVSVNPPPDFRNLIEAASNAPQPRIAGAPDKPSPTSYMTTYYPGTHDRGQAAPIQLHSGDDFPANFTLTPSPSLVVRGSVANLPAGGSAVVMLQSRDFNLTVNGGETRRDGTFEIRDVSPGTYSVVATVSGASVPMMARQSLQVSSDDIEGLRLTPQPGGWIHGQIRIEARAGDRSRPDPRQLFLSLRSADGDDDAISALSLDGGFASLAHVTADGSVEWKSVPPGRYFVQLAGDAVSPDWFLKSAVAGNQDANDAGLTINGGSVIVDLVASANGAVIDGVVANSQGEAVSNAVVVAVPEARFRQCTDRYRKTVSDQAGRFALHGLAPGGYSLYAWESVDGEAYFNPEFLRGYEGQGIALHVSEGDHKSLQLPLIPAADDQQ